MTITHYIACGFLAYLAVGVLLLFIGIVTGRPASLLGGDPKNNNAKDICAILVVGFWGILVPMSLVTYGAECMFKWGFALRKRIYGGEQTSTDDTKE